MIKYFLGLIFSVFVVCSHGQDEPTSAPKINPFSLKGDNLGAIANSVNLFTGDLSLPLNLVSVPGSAGVGIDVSIMYSSANIENIVDVWNLEAPTGVLGLGWSLSYPMIVVDNRSTGARDDDVFYLVEGGASTRLICVGSNGGVKTYKTKTYTNWIVTFTASAGRWEITREDGTKYIYGDQNSGRNTVQWIVKWGNWIGHSNQWSNQRQGLVWNLSEVKNIWGDKITYTYVNDENYVGAGLTFHTEASYLSKIADSWGREVELIYKNKLGEEYADPHTELPEPDAYQERYEKRYLDKIVLKADGIAYTETQLKYVTDGLGTGSLTKRLLKSIVQISSAGTQSPAIEFDYLTSGPMRGALNRVRTQNGSSVTYEYHATGVEANNSNLELDISAPAGFAEPRVFMQNDFAVVTWRQLNGSTHDSNERPVRVYAYSWDGKWREKDLGTIGDVKLAWVNPNYIVHDFQVAIGDDFFAMLRPVNEQTSYFLHIWHKDERVPGSWIQNSYNINLDTHDNTKEVLLAGNDFVAVSNNNGKIIRYVWDGSSWRSSTVSEPVNTHFTTAANNYIISHDTGLNPDVIKMYYLDELKNWQTKTVSSILAVRASKVSKAISNLICPCQQSAGDLFMTTPIACLKPTIE